MCISTNLDNFFTEIKSFHWLHKCHHPSIALKQTFNAITSLVHCEVSQPPVPKITKYKMIKYPLKYWYKIRHSMSVYPRWIHKTTICVCLFFFVNPKVFRYYRCFHLFLKLFWDWGGRVWEGGWIEHCSCTVELYCTDFSNTVKQWIVSTESWCGYVKSRKELS